jgi:hypothetical protein
VRARLALRLVGLEVVHPLEHEILAVIAHLLADVASAGDRVWVRVVESVSLSCQAKPQTNRACACVRARARPRPRPASLSQQEQPPAHLDERAHRAHIAPAL